MLFLTAYRSFADRERIFSLISFIFAERGFLDANLNKIDSLCKDSGLQGHYHPHLSTIVEGPEEVDVEDSNSGLDWRDASPPPPEPPTVEPVEIGDLGLLSKWLLDMNEFLFISKESILNISYPSSLELIELTFSKN